MYLHQPDGTRRAIGYLSQYGDILRVSFDRDYIDDPARPVLSLSYQGATEAATREILTSARDARLVRNDGRWPAYFQNLLPEGHNRERLAEERHCSPDDEFELLAFKMCGVDLTRIDGVDVTTALAVVSETGADMSRFPSVEHFASWLGLCPGTKITGGKVMSGKSKRCANRAAQALRLAAAALRTSQSALGAYFRRMCSRMDKPKAVTAAARRLGRLIYTMR